MTTSAPLNSTTCVLVTTPAGALAPGGAPWHVAPVVLSFDVANYTKWAIYMKASLRRAGLIGQRTGDGALLAARFVRIQTLLSSKFLAWKNIDFFKRILR
jgi:hypothetical protein